MQGIMNKRIVQTEVNNSKTKKQQAPISFRHLEWGWGWRISQSNL